MNGSGNATSPSQRSTTRERKLAVIIDGQMFEHGLPDKGVVVLGRDESADIVIPHSTLSRRHAELSISTHTTIKDCGSTNGTIVGGRRLTSGEPVLVVPGAAIELGDALVVLRTASGPADILGSSDGDEAFAYRDSFERSLGRIAATRASVLIAGESGTGKTFVAQRIHALSSQKDGPFVVLRGNARTTVPQINAAIESARGGVVFVAQPSDLEPMKQLALERALATAGGELRLLVSSTIDLAPVAEDGRFLRELFHRIATLRIVVPPLRARIREMSRLVDELLTELAQEQDRPPMLVSSEALTVLERHTWPGNIRELKSVLTRAAVLGAGRILTASHLAFVIEPAAASESSSLSSALSDAEHRRILQVLRECKGNQTQAAKMLGISRGTLISRLERYAIPRPRK